MAGQPTFADLSKMVYSEQAIWFMNGFWGSPLDSDAANQIWQYVEKFVELDNMSTPPKGAQGNELDQFFSAKFLEDMDKAMSAQQRKEAFRKIDHDNNGKMSCIEYLTFKYDKKPDEVADAPQGDNTAAIKKAQAALHAVSTELAAVESKLEENKKQEATLQQYKKEVQDAIAEVERQEKELKDKISSLEAQKQAGGVKGARAGNELAQLQAEDPLPLRRAKITQDAALRKVTKQEAVVKKVIESLEEAYKSLEEKMNLAQKELEEIQSKPGGCKGALWWMQRELFEADKRLPTKKQKFDHSKPFSFEPTV